MNATVSRISERIQRGRVGCEMWARHNVVNALAMIATVGSWRVVGFEDAAGLVSGSRGLVSLKNVLLRGALVTSLAPAALGARIASQSARGDVPVESGWRQLRRPSGGGPVMAPDRLLRQGVTGAAGAAAIAVSAALEARAAADATSKGVFSWLLF